MEMIYQGNLSETLRLNERVCLRMGNLPIRDQCNTGIVRTQDGIVLVDYPEQDPGEEILQEAESLYGGKVTHILFTHAHGDHRNGLHTLCRQDITLVARLSSLQELEQLGLGKGLNRLAVDGGDVVNIGGVPFSFWIPPAVPAHSPWDLTILLPEDGLAFSGDFIVPPEYLYCHSSNVRNWLTGLEAFEREVFQETLLMGHGAPVFRVDALHTLISYLRSLSELVGGGSGVQHSALQALCEQTSSETVLRQLRELEQQRTCGG